MTDIEVALADLGELATREIAKVRKPIGLIENKKIAQMGGNTAKVARKDLESKLELKVVVEDNRMNHNYIDNNRIN